MTNLASPAIKSTLEFATLTFLAYVKDQTFLGSVCLGFAIENAVSAYDQAYPEAKLYETAKTSVMGLWAQAKEKMKPSDPNILVECPEDCTEKLNRPSAP